MKIHRLVVTGPQHQLAAFQNQAAMIVNPVSYNGKSVLYTCPDRLVDAAKNLAGQSECAVQVWDGNKWSIVVDGQLTW